MSTSEHFSGAKKEQIQVHLGVSVWFDAVPSDFSVCEDSETLSILCASLFFYAIKLNGYPVKEEVHFPPYPQKQNGLFHLP